MDAVKVGDFAFLLYDKVIFISPACLIADILYENIPHGWSVATALKWRHKKHYFLFFLAVCFLLCLSAFFMSNLLSFCHCILLNIAYLFVYFPLPSGDLTTAEWRVLTEVPSKVDKTEHGLSNYGS
jgi:hypothetical protein